MDNSRSATTRYLCAAAYLDAAFADEVIDQVVEQEHRAIGACHGVDLVPVVRHSLAARQLHALRNWALGLVLAGVVLGGVLLDGGQVTFWTLLLLFWGVVMTEQCTVRFGVIAGRLLPRNFDPDPVSVRPTRQQQRRLDEVARDQDGNVTAYSGFTPFVGAGTRLDPWSFAVNVCAGKREELGGRREPKAFEVEELYDHVTEQLAAMSLPGLELEDRLYVNGRDVREQGPVFFDAAGERPRAAVAPEVVTAFLRRPTHAVRHYKVIRVTDWQGELVWSMFLRFVRVADSLFVESSDFLLLPVKERYHQIDAVRPLPTLPDLARVALASLWTAVALSLLWPLFAARKAMRWFRQASERRGVRRELRGDHFFDFGAAVSLRERASSGRYQHYFQQLDKQMYAKLLQRRVLALVVEFLDDHDIDTSELVERQSTILNNGVMVSGGTLQAESLAVGEGAVATVVNRVSQVIRKATPAAQPGGGKAG
jgi:hypothetical protein